MCSAAEGDSIPTKSLCRVGRQLRLRKGWHGPLPDRRDARTVTNCVRLPECGSGFGVAAPLDKFYVPPLTSCS